MNVINVYRLKPLMVETDDRNMPRLHLVFADTQSMKVYFPTGLECPEEFSQQVLKKDFALTFGEGPPKGSVTVNQ